MAIKYAIQSVQSITEAIHSDIQNLEELALVRKDWARGQIRALEQFNSSPLQSILCRCVETNPLDRFRSAQELCKALAL